MRQAPFGRALISLVADHCASESGNQSMYHSRENNLTLWTSLANKRLESGAFVHTFYGHNDIVLDYHWLERCAHPTRPKNKRKIRHFSNFTGGTKNEKAKSKKGNFVTFCSKISFYYFENVLARKE